MIRWAWLADLFGSGDVVDADTGHHWGQPLSRYVEEDIPTEPGPPPTLPSCISPDSAVELANSAIDARDYETAKEWLRYADQSSRRFPK